MTEPLHTTGANSDAQRVVALLDAHTTWRPCALVPEISAWHADDEVQLWQALEHAAQCPQPVPYFAIPWPASLAVARAMLDGRIDVKAARVADIGCGVGVVACAALMAGAREVHAYDVDTNACVAAAELCARHGVGVKVTQHDALADPHAIAADVVVCADLVSRATQAAGFQWAVRHWQQAARVVLADSGRPFFDAGAATQFDTVTVPTVRGVDGRDTRTVRLYVS